VRSKIPYSGKAQQKARRSAPSQRDKKSTVQYWALPGEATSNYMASGPIIPNSCVKVRSRDHGTCRARMANSWYGTTVVHTRVHQANPAKTTLNPPTHPPGCLTKKKKKKKVQDKLYDTGSDGGLKKSILTFGEAIRRDKISPVKFLLTPQPLWPATNCAMAVRREHL